MGQVAVDVDMYGISFSVDGGQELFEKRFRAQLRSIIPNISSYRIIKHTQANIYNWNDPCRIWVEYQEKTAYQSLCESWEMLLGVKI